MSNLNNYLEENNFARKMLGKYLLNERKYDKYGTQGKLILLQEILSEEGFQLQEGMNYQELINEIFPRTFYCENRRNVNSFLAKTILKYFK